MARHASSGRSKIVSNPDRSRVKSRQCRVARTQRRNDSVQNRFRSVSITAENQAIPGRADATPERFGPKSNRTGRNAESNRSEIASNRSAIGSRGPGIGTSGRRNRSESRRNRVESTQFWMKRNRGCLLPEAISVARSPISEHVRAKIRRPGNGQRTERSGRGLWCRATLPARRRSRELAVGTSPHRLLAYATVAAAPSNSDRRAERRRGVRGATGTDSPACA